MYTREEFTQKLAARKKGERRDARLLAATSVGLGLAQLLLIRWIDAMLARRPAVIIEGSVFLAYMALVVWLLWRMLRHRGEARVTCPRCGVRLEELSERVALATGRCDSCGGQVIADGGGGGPALDAGKGGGRDAFASPGGPGTAG